MIEKLPLDTAYKLAEHRVYLVNGTEVRTSVDSGFSKVSSYLDNPSIPEGEIWVDGALDLEEAKAAVDEVLSDLRATMVKEAWAVEKILTAKRPRPAGLSLGKSAFHAGAQVALGIFKASDWADNPDRPGDSGLEEQVKAIARDKGVNLGAKPDPEKGPVGELEWLMDPGKSEEAEEKIREQLERRNAQNKPPKGLHELDGETSGGDAGWGKADQTGSAIGGGGGRSGP